MGLGWLRLLLSLLVMDAHFEGFRGTVQPWLVQQFGVDQLSYIGSGGVAVTGFFVISGYVIAYVLARNYDTRCWNGIGRFYLGRALRIYPLYLLVLGGYGSVLIALGRWPLLSPGALLDNLLLLPYAVRNSVADFNIVGTLQLSQQLLIGPAWTLTLDLLLYVAAPLLLVRRDTTWLVWLIGLVYGLIFAALSDSRPPLWFAYFYSSLPPYGFAFASGALVFHYRERWRPPVWLTGLAVGLVAVLLWLPLGLTNTPLNQVLLTLAFAVWVARLGQRPRVGRGEQLAGDLTYATYLLHVPILQGLQASGFAHPVLATAALTYGLGLLAVYSVEYPLDRWRAVLTAGGMKQERQAPEPGWLPGGRLVAGGLMALWLFICGWGLVVNLPMAGQAVAWRSTACPTTWQCAVGMNWAEVQFTTAGEWRLPVAAPLPRRWVVDVRHYGVQGEAFAGFGLQLAGGASGRAGILRHGDRCKLLLPPGGPQPVLAWWNTDCRLPHRLVLDLTTGWPVLALDSLWVLPLPPLVAVESALTAEQETTGGARIEQVFVGSRR